MRPKSQTYVRSLGVVQRCVAASPSRFLWASELPGCTQDGSRRPHQGLRSNPDGPRGTQERPKRTPRRPRISECSGPDGDAQLKLQPVLADALQDGPKGPSRPPRWPRECPERSREGPKGAKHAPSVTSRWFLDASPKTLASQPLASTLDYRYTFAPPAYKPPGHRLWMGWRGCAKRQ